MDVQVALRISYDLDQEIEAWIADMRPKPTKSAAIRELIVEGLKAIKAEKAEKPPKGRK
ncbi:MAG TPA: hypothetical protein VH913_14205 [Hyphomicrobiaceae bacterium]|jgi:hypothetical protein